MPGPSRWSDVSALRLPGFDLDDDASTASFYYTLVSPTAPLHFTETVRFAPGADPFALRRVLDLLYVAAGTSYYKIAAPGRVVLDAVDLAPAAMRWAEAVYRRGLAEFAYRNDLPHILDLPIEGTAGSPANTHDQGQAPLVPVGGGKDSIVSAEALRRAGLAPTLFAVSPNRIIHDVIAVSGLPVLTATRTLDPRLTDLNRAGAYNGHVPVTAMNSLIAVATAVRCGLGPVVMSNESSASIPNLTWHGHDINHQWSKGLEAETLLRDALAAHAGLDGAYFSLLRGLTEVAIAGHFSEYRAYDAVVTSCNAAFKRTGASDRWCGHCPKCQFVFLALAPFVGRARLVAIFGTDLLNDSDQLPGYREIVGLDAFKPFECVGDAAESLVALRLVVDGGEWRDAPVVRALLDAIPAETWPTDVDVKRILAGDGPSLAPAAFRAALDRAALDSAALDRA